jgi:hypothetical protein
MRNASPKCCSGKQNTYFVLDKPFSENLAVCEIMCEKYGKSGEAT